MIHFKLLVGTGRFHSIYRHREKVMDLKIKYSLNFWSLLFWISSLNRLMVFSDRNLQHTFYTLPSRSKGFFMIFSCDYILEKNGIAMKLFAQTRWPENELISFSSPLSYSHNLFYQLIQNNYSTNFYWVILEYPWVCYSTFSD